MLILEDEPTPIRKWFTAPVERTSTYSSSGQTNRSSDYGSEECAIKKTELKYISVCASDLAPYQSLIDRAKEILRGQATLEIRSQDSFEKAGELANMLIAKGLVVGAECYKSKKNSKTCPNQKATLIIVVKRAATVKKESAKPGCMVV